MRAAVRGSGGAGFASIRRRQTAGSRSRVTLGAS